MTKLLNNRRSKTGPWPRSRPLRCFCVTESIDTKAKNDKQNNLYHRVPGIAGESLLPPALEGEAQRGAPIH